MFKNYVKVAWRNLTKNKVFSLINILGLTLGITVCLMIFLFILNEFSFDKFHTRRDNIYRVMRGFDSKGKNERVPYLSPPYATALLNDYPSEIKSAVRVMPSNGLISFGNEAFNENKLYLADAEFFSLFSFPLIKGNPATVLKDPLSIVLSEATATKYFGNAENAIGKFLTLDKSLRLTVTGIAQNVPPNSHLDFDAVVPLSNYAQFPFFSGWMNNNLFTYVLLNQGTSKAGLEKRFPQFMDKYLGSVMAQVGTRFDLALTPLTDIYFEPASAFDNVKHGNKNVVYIFLSIAVLILLIGCINFMNLSTIRAVERSKEVGLRKVLGALRKFLVWQFIGESILITLISCALSVALMLMLLPVYNELLGYSLLVSWTTWPLYLFLLAIIIIVGFLAGSYPAFFLSAFSPIEALKGKLRLGKGGSLFRQALVVVQFSITVFLIIGTIVIMNQMHYVKSKALGYDDEQTLIIKLNNEDIFSNRNAFKNNLLNNSNIAAVSLMSGEPGGFFDVQNFEAQGKSEVMRFRTEFADFDFVKTLGLKLTAGRDFSQQFGTDSTEAVLVNRTAVNKLGLSPQQALGTPLRNAIRDSLPRKIVGVVEDFNFLSLKENMDALVISPLQDRRVAVIKLKPGRIEDGVKAVQSAYSKVAPVYPLEYTFLDQKFETTYRTDIRQQNILTIFSGLAIFIACLGLFGLASFIANKRTKEIGVRKVLGSSANNIVLLLSKELLKPVLIATVIAIPLAYYAMFNWLQNFAYRTSLDFWVFLVAALVTFFIALLTVSLKAVSAALVNPAQSLRSE
ncbi:FtsX-like permease family protein [Segetibacter sp. 3557_3]|uniref:ABC transporter permease n=1 Tax=Segetibacter sp. 3557_3 TaxID=2547429 RepID=UPI0010590AFA|nr:ABC transporter permease [Segetibacter sp. 3557_3]TDH25245.1 FtsX-like permease family protein [Segetibacter sp. 3557_3]